MKAWIEAEAASADFGDERFNRRFDLLLDRSSDKPTPRLPAACGGWTETAARLSVFQ